MISVRFRNGFMTTEGIQTNKQTNIVLPARGIYQGLKNVPMQILVTNSSKGPATLPKNMLITVDPEPPETVITYEKLGTHRKLK